MTQQQKLTALELRFQLATELCPHWDYFDWTCHRLECCRERLAAERELRRIRRPLATGLTWSTTP
jgi:hypothetical protein